MKALTARSIRTLRKALALDSFAFAAALGVHTSTVYRWESAKALVSVDMLQGEILTRLLAIPRRKLLGVGLAARRGLLTDGMIGGLAGILKHLSKPM